MLYDSPARKIKNNDPKMPSVNKDLRVRSYSHMMRETKAIVTHSTAKIDAQFVFTLFCYFSKMSSYS